MSGPIHVNPLSHNDWTTPGDSQSVDFHRPPFCLPRRLLAFAPNVTVIYPADAVCVDMAERWRQLREKGRAEGEQLKLRIEDDAGRGRESSRWERLCRRWASKH